MDLAPSFGARRGIYASSVKNMSWKIFFLWSCMGFAFASADCEFFNVTGHDARVTGMYLKSDYYSTENDAVFKLQGKDMYIFNSTSRLFNGWRIGDRSDMVWRQHSSQYYYKGNVTTQYYDPAQKWKNWLGDKSVYVKCGKCCSEIQAGIIGNPLPSMSGDVYRQQGDTFGGYTRFGISNGKPWYKSDNGKYAIWSFGSPNNLQWLLGPRNMLGRHSAYLYNEINSFCPPMEGDYNWMYHNQYKNWAPAHRNFSLNCLIDGNGQGLGYG